MFPTQHRLNAVAQVMQQPILMPNSERFHSFAALNATLGDANLTPFITAVLVYDRCMVV